MPARALTAPAASPPPSPTPASGGSARGPGIARTRAGRPILGLRTACLGGRRRRPERLRAAARAFAVRPLRCGASPGGARVRQPVASGGAGAVPLLSVRVRPTPLAVRPVPSSLAPAAVVAARAVEADRLEHDRSLSPGHVVVQVHVPHRRRALRRRRPRAPSPSSSRGRDARPDRPRRRPRPARRCGSARRAATGSAAPGSARRAAAARPRRARSRRRRTRSASSTWPKCGIETRWSQCSRTSRRMPRPSPPSTSATGRVRSTASQRSVPAASKPTTQMPRALSASSACTRLPMRATFTCSSAPADARPTVSESPALWRSGSSTPSAPAASTVRRMAPRLRGSSTPSSATTSAGSCAEPSRLVERQHRLLRDHGDDALVRDAARHAVERLAHLEAERDRRGWSPGGSPRRAAGCAGPSRSAGGRSGASRRRAPRAPG